LGEAQRHGKYQRGILADTLFPIVVVGLDIVLMH